MENDINITKILKDKSENTMLYSSLFGNVYLYLVDTNFVIVQHYGLYIRFLPNAKYSGYDEVEAEPTLFPSKEMRDWSKFSWKRGDILVSNDGGTEVIFDEWYDDTYTSFYCKHYLNSEDENKIVYYEAFICTTERYAIEDKDKAQIYIGIIEERLGGKLNRETLEVEKAQPEFKDGDIVVTDAIPSMYYSKCIFILKGDLYTKDSKAHSYVFYNISNNHISFDVADTIIRDREIRLATNPEKLQLFGMLTKEGKYWDSANKQIVDLKEYQFKPFEKVLVRDSYDDVWIASFFNVTTCVTWKFCIPYKGNEHLLGTTYNFE